MAGHSKWKNIQHRKGKQDALRGKLFTKISREIFSAARSGGGNPDTNFRLRMAIDKAREANMPSDNIQRTIDKALGNIPGVTYEEMVYEGYGPGGVAVMLELLTDNRNRTAAEIRHIFSKRGGNLGETGCVGWMFERKGVLTVNKEDSSLSEDDLMMLALDAGAQDFSAEDDQYEITTAPEDFAAVQEALVGQGVKFEDATVTFVPQNTVELRGEDARKMLELYEALEEHDDVQAVYSNFEISDEELEKIG
ncbi:YebC/PmpR family DNA-binding transcriptional regulator [Effusibacillus lacus]|uniref:Probable transcriptional regulatory protein EFBL_3146 n=1 Tax=Effusibacillus lacus TaxID=1348429 RepID=A0A292YK41_9BACL|nr:YebC/PmpR family DNA-binding transcriptional regulator [Effusibacillus lacus]TCS68954.1 YebC/PmpR family DNA-binding regulatory protein [Effusibacillus lacus]GAX91477.1 YebC/PmpR family DNA-binding transcriptional regulator [Effusibacillus lacus]